MAGEFYDVCLVTSHRGAHDKCIAELGKFVFTMEHPPMQSLYGIQLSLYGIPRKVPEAYVQVHRFNPITNLQASYFQRRLINGEERLHVY